MPCIRGKVKPITRNSMAEPPSHFFNVILPSTLAEKKPGIPQTFVKKFEGELSAVAKLRVPNGRVWEVGLTIDGRSIWFRDGWHDFVQYHSICAGYFLVFKYAKNSSFQVLIFDKTACEIHYPYNAEEPVNDERDEMKNRLQCCEDSTKYKPQNRKYKMAERADRNELNYENMEYEFSALLKEMGIFITQRYQLLSKEEKQRAINIARILKPRHPSFMVIIRPLAIRDYLKVPNRFVFKYLSREASRIMRLKVSHGKEWPVQICTFSTGGFRLTRGWPRFVKDNNFKEGDICVFELISMKNFILKVSVDCACRKLP